MESLKKKEKKIHIGSNRKTDAIEVVCVNKITRAFIIRCPKWKKHLHTTGTLRLLEAIYDAFGIPKGSYSEDEGM